MDVEKGCDGHDTIMFWRDCLISKVETQFPEASVSQECVLVFTAFSRLHVRISS